MNTVTVQASKTYEVKIGSGLLDTIGQELSRIAKGKVMVITDETVAPLYLGRVYRSLTQAGFTVYTSSVPSGEGSKDLKYYVNLLELVAEKQLTRSDTLIALGGGVVGDLTGFVAASYLRGIRFVQIPTTLLAMVDSSVGGKTAVNLRAGKNLAGAFHQPSLVLCDPSLLDTLEEDVFRAGCAEVLKTAILFDRELFAHLREKTLNFDREWVITRCIQWKRDIVCADEFDRGQRQLLNLGHTVGHAIEALTEYDTPHGYAVAVGCCIIARAFSQDQEEIVDCFRAFGLPTDSYFSAKVLAGAALSDKKRQGDTITIVVPTAIGDCKLRSIPISELETVIKVGLTHE
ncbi:MAG: 3-dehydroquinate synthase [Oscillospiraceae bacterium]|nr:3-dehydroquinate synthase [Oscillospiraceae bacterium]